jgi:hypothetical protein
MTDDSSAKRLCYPFRVTRLFLPRSTTCFLVWIAAIAAGVTTGSAAEFLPDATAEGAMPLSGETWELAGPGYVVRVQLIDDAGRQAYLRRVTGMPTDPFASPPDRPPGFITFLLQIENQGEGDLVFQAQNCWLVTDKQEHLYPVGMEGLRATYGMLGRELTPAYERAQSALLENAFTLRPEGSVAGLLVYRAVKPKTRRIQLDLQLTSSTGDVIRLHAPYLRPKKKGGKDKP